MEIVGWIGAIMLAACAWPQAYACFKAKSAAGLSLPMLFLWTAGEVFQMAYAMSLGAVPIVANCILNLIPLCVIWRYVAHEI